VWWQWRPHTVRGDVLCSFAGKPELHPTARFNVHGASEPQQGPRNRGEPHHVRRRTAGRTASNDACGVGGGVARAARNRHCVHVPRVRPKQAPVQQAQRAMSTVVPSHARQERQAAIPSSSLPATGQAGKLSHACSRQRHASQKLVGSR